MYEMHAWFKISETAFERDAGSYSTIIDDLRREVQKIARFSLRCEIFSLNGHYFLTIDRFTNRKRAAEVEETQALIDAVRQRAPGSFGLIYERDDEAPEGQGANEFLVTMLARGQLTRHPDPFLSPLNPVVED